MSTHTVEVSLTPFWDSLTVTGDYTAGDPGQSSGPVEICYQGWDAEVEIESITLTLPDGSVLQIPIEAFDDFTREDLHEQFRVNLEVGGMLDDREPEPEY